MNSLAFVGQNALEAAFFSHKLGYDTFLIDSYDFSDKVPFTHLPTPEKYSASSLVSFAVQNLPSNTSVIPIGGCVRPDLIERLGSHFRVISNSPSEVERARNWNHLRPILEDCGASYPRSFHVDEDSDFLSLDLKDAILKKKYSGGGLSARYISNVQDFPSISDDYLLQEFVPGKVYGCLVLSNGEKARAVSTNHQLIGEGFLNATSFKYCGNVVPSNLPFSVKSEMKRVSEFLVSNLNLKGLNGVDFIYDGSRAYVIEVNPRLVDSFYPSCCFLDANLLQSHLAAFSGRDLSNFQKKDDFFAKAVFYAPENAVFDASLKENFSNVPPRGSRVGKNEPVCCLYAQGDSMNNVLSVLKKRAGFLEDIL